MARTILIIGESGAGKTTSARTLDPNTTFYIDCDKKGLSFKGWRKMYNKEHRNYVANSSAAVVWQCLNRCSNDPEFQHVKTVIIDTLNGIMIDDEFRRMNEKGYDKWADMAQSIYQIISDAHDLRDDLTIICTAHCQTDRDDNGYNFTRMKTSGRKLDKIVPESKFTTVLLAKGNDEQYVFETTAKHSTAKSPMGCFESAEIPNDLKFVIDALDKYENEDLEEDDKNV